MKAKLSRNGWISMLLLSVLLLSVLPMSALATLNDEDQVTSTEFTLSGYGYGQDTAACRVISAKSGAATEVYIYEQGVCDEMNGLLTTDRYLQAGKQYYFMIRYNAHLEDIAGFADAFKPEETPLLLNGEPCELAEYYKENDITGEEFYTAYYELPVLEAIPVVIPFTKTVEQGGDVAPGEETFRLEIFDIGNSNAEEYADVTYTAEVKTKGAGKFDGKIVFTGPADQIDSMLSEGFLVREVKGSAENWSYSDAVWAIIPEWNEQQEKVFVVYSTTKVPDADGDYYAATETSVEKMSFENTYTKNDEPQSPATGDNTMMGMLALLFVSGTGVLGTTVFSRKRKM